MIGFFDWLGRVQIGARFNHLTINAFVLRILAHRAEPEQQHGYQDESEAKDGLHERIICTLLSFRQVEYLYFCSTGTVSLALK